MPDEPPVTRPETPLPTASNGRLRQAFRALRYRNYRLFFFGQGISLIGTWMQMVALSWLMHELTGSAEMLGRVAFVNRLPTGVLAPFAGVVVDRLDRRRLVMVCQVLAMVQALVLAALTLSGRVEVWQVFWLSGGLGIVTALEIPARQAFFVELIEERDDLGNAIALNSSLFNSARLVGPAIAGALIAVWGEGTCFLLNGVSYLAVLTGLALIKVPPKELVEDRPGVLQTLREGFRYALGFRPILILLMFALLVGLCGMPYTVIMPTFAAKVLHSGSHGYGLILSGGGIGALVGAIFLAQRSTVRGLGPIIVYAAVAYAAGATLSSLTDQLWLVVFLMPLIGGGLTIMMASLNTILQSICDDDKRGRIISLYVLFSMGSFPVGSLLAGALADRYGVPWTLRGQALLVLLAALLFATRIRQMRAMVRPIYIAKGIITGVRSEPLGAAQARVELRDKEDLGVNG